jgi:hypothetical protein
MYGRYQDLNHCAISIFRQDLMKSSLKELSEIKYNNTILVV